MTTQYHVALSRYINNNYYTQQHPCIFREVMTTQYNVGMTAMTMRYSVNRLQMLAYDQPEWNRLM